MAYGYKDRKLPKTKGEQTGPSEHTAPCMPVDIEPQEGKDWDHSMGKNFSANKHKMDFVEHGDICYCPKKK